MKTCKKCNLSYDENEKFCKKCGNPLTTEYQIDFNNTAKKNVFQDRIKADPLNVGLLHEYAQFLFNTLLFRKTITICLRILEINKNDSTANELLYKSYLKLKMFKEALESGKKLLSEKPTDIILQQELADLSGKMDDAGKATEYYDQNLELQPAKSAALLNKAHNFLKENQLERAIEIFSDLYQEGQNDRITSIYAGIHKAIKADFKDSIKLLTSVLCDNEYSKQNDIDTNRGVLYLAYSLCRNSSDMPEIKKWAIAINYEILNQNHHPHDEQTALFIAEYIINQSLNDLDDRQTFSNAKSQITDLADTYLPKNFYSKNNNSRIAEIWYSIGLKQSKLQLLEDAKKSFQKASDLVPDEKKYKEKTSEHTNLSVSHIHKRKRKTNIMIVVYALEVIIIIFSFFTYKIIKERNAFNLAKDVNTSISYQKFLKKFPTGKYSSEALKLRTAAEELDEKNAFEKARNENTSTSYQAYMDIYPSGEYYFQASDLRDQANELDEKKAFEKARKNNTSISYQNFLKKFPGGKYSSKALKLRTAAEELEEKNTFEEARNEDTSTSYQAYMDKDTNGTYYYEALRISDQANELDEKNAFEKARQENTSSSYQTYLDKYPKGNYYYEALKLQIKADGYKFTDSRDGNVYKMIIIGEQVWMAENLAYLPVVVGPVTGSQTEPHFYVYGYWGTDVAAAKATANYTTYGVLYNWPSAMNGAASSTANPSGIKGVCPPGWHLPSKSEWDQLVNYLGGNDSAGGKMKETGFIHWQEPNNGATNESGFSSVPGGSVDDKFKSIGTKAFFWSSTENTSIASLQYELSCNNTRVDRLSYYGGKNYGLSVRCVR